MNDKEFTLIVELHDCDLRKSILYESIKHWNTIAAEKMPIVGQKETHIFNVSFTVDYEVTENGTILTNLNTIPNGKT